MPEAIKTEAPNSEVHSLSFKPASTCYLDQLTIAAENMRAQEPADDGIDELAQTLLAGQLEPLFVRHASDSLGYAILDGRRRFFAFQRLNETCAIDGSTLPISIKVCETTEEIAAATVVSNTARLDVTTADYLLAVKRFSEQFKSADQIGRILGIPVKTVRQLAKLGSVDRRFLEALKEGKITLINLRKIARLTDPAKVEALAVQIDTQGYISPSTLSDAGKGGTPADSAIARVVGMIAYTAAGGAIDKDLFEEQPDSCLDTDLLNSLWADTIKPVVAALEGLGLTVYSGPVAQDRVPDGVELTYAFESDTPYTDRNDAKLAAEEQADLSVQLFDAGERIEAIVATVKWALASAEWFRLQAKPLTPYACFLSPGVKLLQLKFFVSRTDYSAWQKKKDARTKAKDTQTATQATVKAASAYHEPVIEVDTDGYQNGMHETCSNLAGLSLALTLSNDVAAAFDAQLSSQFQQCVLRSSSYVTYGETPDKLLQISVRGMAAADSSHPVFLKPIVDRLQVYKDAWQASDLHPFEWVRTLSGAQKADVFALITALQVSTHESKTNLIRRITRAEAGFVARATGHHFRNHLLPDAEFYAGFSKRQLLGWLDDMQVRNKKLHDGLGKPDLAVLVADFAREHQFVPASLDFDLPPADPGEPDLSSSPPPAGEVAPPEAVSEGGSPNYARFNDLKVGDILIADGGFTSIRDEHDDDDRICLDEGEECEVKADANGDLYVDCLDGKHLLRGQCNEAGEVVGLTPKA